MLSKCCNFEYLLPKHRWLHQLPGYSGVASYSAGFLCLASLAAISLGFASVSTAQELSKAPPSQPQVKGTERTSFRPAVPESRVSKSVKGTGLTLRHA